MKLESKTYYICDLCGTKTDDHKLYTKFTYGLGWESGVHSGYTPKEGHVCNECKKSRLRRWLAYKFAI